MVSNSCPKKLRSKDPTTAIKSWEPVVGGFDGKPTRKSPNTWVRFLLNKYTKQKSPNTWVRFQQKLHTHFGPVAIEAGSCRYRLPWWCWQRRRCPGCTAWPCPCLSFASEGPKMLFRSPAQGSTGSYKRNRSFNSNKITFRRYDTIISFQVSRSSQTKNGRSIASPVVRGTGWVHDGRGGARHTVVPRRAHHGPVVRDPGQGVQCDHPRGAV